MRELHALGGFISLRSVIVPTVSPRGSSEDGTEQCAALLSETLPESTPATSGSHSLYPESWPVAHTLLFGGVLLPTTPDTKEGSGESSYTKSQSSFTLRSNFFFLNN